MESSDFFLWKDGVYKLPPLYRFHALKIRGNIGAVKFVMEHDMEISMKTGHYENPDNRGLLASRMAYYNVEVYTSEPGVPKFYTVVYNIEDILYFLMFEISCCLEFLSHYLFLMMEYLGNG